MSLYNMMCGNNPLFTLLHAVLGTVAPLPPIPRYRDTYTMMVVGSDGTADELLRIIIYTRTGGGNRAEYEEQNRALANHPLYACDYDDNFDDTFAHFEFKVPEEWVERIQKFHEVWSRHPKGRTPRQKFDSAMAQLKNEPEAPYVPPTDEEIEDFTNLVEQMADELHLTFAPPTEDNDEN